MIYTLLWRTSCATVWKNEKFSLTKKIFRQINSLVISLVKTLLSRNFCQKCMRLNRSNFQTVRRFHDLFVISLSKRNISSNQLFSNFFSKNVTFTKFLPMKGGFQIFREIKAFPFCFCYRRSLQAM